MGLLNSKLDNNQSRNPKIQKLVNEIPSRPSGGPKLTIGYSDARYTNEDDNNTEANLKSVMMILKIPSAAAAMTKNLLKLTQATKRRMMRLRRSSTLLLITLLRAIRKMVLL